MTIDPYTFLFILPHRTVLLTSLDENKKPLEKKTATGFIVKENENFFLYTCWHVMSGYNMYDIHSGNYPSSPPLKKYLRLNFHKYMTQKEGEVVVAMQEPIDIALYDDVIFPVKPLWYQDAEEEPNAYFSKVNIKIPKFLDIAKIEIPSDHEIEEHLCFHPQNFFSEAWPWVGEKVYLAGFPYGYSSLGREQPCPVVLTHHVAATFFEDRREDFLLDAAGAPGMSGGPVLIERNKTLMLLGVYQGTRYPTKVLDGNQIITQFGIVTKISSLCQKPLIPY